MKLLRKKSFTLITSWLIILLAFSCQDAIEPVEPKSLTKDEIAQQVANSEEFKTFIVLTQQLTTSGNTETELLENLNQHEPEIIQCVSKIDAISSFAGLTTNEKEEILQNIIFDKMESSDYDWVDEEDGGGQGGGPMACALCYYFYSKCEEFGGNNCLWTLSKCVAENCLN